MGQLIVTAVLASLVVGGGVFIFWPDLSSKLPKRAEKKKKLSKQEVNARDIYRNHYTTTDELIEVSQLMQDGLNKEVAKDKIVERGDELVRLLSNASQHKYTCPVCYHDNRIHAGIASIHCKCDNREFKNKIHTMVKEAGYQHY